MIAFGLSIEEAWRMTVPDWFGLAAAHSAYHAAPDGDSSIDGTRDYSADEVEQLHAAMRREIQEDGGKTWQPV